MIHYRVSPADLHAHLFAITLAIPAAQAQQRVALPVWIAGSYLVREFSQHLQQLSAWQGPQRLPLQQLDKCTWQVDCQAGAALELRYEVYAFDNSVRTAFLSSERGFFNPSSLCLRVLGQEEGGHAIELIAPENRANWAVATGASGHTLNQRGWGSYHANNYDALLDTPFELGEFWSGEFVAAGVQHRFVVAGAGPHFDGTRLLADAQKICQSVIAFWHNQPAEPSPLSAVKMAAERAASAYSATDFVATAAAPFDHYVFMLNAVHDGYGGLEHGNSTALICNRKDLPQREPTGASGASGSGRPHDGYTTLMGLICHEYFHAWNVKRLRPAEFARYQYASEQYTELLWFFEGFTSYYDDLLLRRAGLIDDAAYLKLLNKSINQVQQTPGRWVQSVAQASFDAWVKYYRPNENTPNATVSYYSKGALVALCFDLTLRQAGQGAGLDGVMRALWQRCQAGPMREADFLAVLQAQAGRSFAPELAAWVHSTQELPLQNLLEAQGVQVHHDPAQMAQRLGLRVAEGTASASGAGRLQVKVVLRGGVAEQAGLAAGDEWLGVNGWRMQSLDDLAQYAAQGELQVLVSRDRRLLSLQMAAPPLLSTWRLAVHDAARVGAWLGA